MEPSCTPRALEPARDRYRELFEHAPVAYLVLDREGRVCTANHAACELVRLATDQLVGIRLAALLPVDDADRLDLCLRAVGDGVARRLEVELLVPEGTVPVVLDMTLWAGGGILVVASAALVRSIATSAVAHEVNNLLQVIGASLGELDRAVADRAARERVRASQDTLAHCRQLVDRLFASGIGDRRRVHDVSLDELVAHMLDRLRALVGCTIHVDADLAAPAARVACDPAELELVLVNLATNARDAMPGGGHLVVSTRMAERGRVVLRVEDTGLGMSAEVQDLIFEPLFTTKRGGHGLGLATCREIVERARGTIHVASTRGAGTRFEIALPLATRFALGTEQRPRVELPPDRAAGETILVVEDNAPTRSAICEHLDALGYRVLVAEDPTSALASARAHHVDLAVIDYRLRSVSGEVLARHLRALHPALRVLFTSGYPRESLELAEPFLQKPFSLDELARAVGDVLEAR